ncbi:hypothetical protein CLV53_1071, partial [Sediminibacterium magnilacihabitans]
CTVVAENSVSIVADFYVLLIAENSVVVIADYMGTRKREVGYQSGTKINRKWGKKMGYRQ